MLFVVVPLLFFAMLAVLKLGYRMGMKRIEVETEHERVGLVSVETAIFGLLGLVLAFTYSGASQRFEQRRALTIQEANAVGSAWLTMDLIPAPAQPALRDKFRRYGRAHSDAYHLLPDLEAFDRKLAEAQALQLEIWKDSVAALRDSSPAANQLTLAALSDLMNTTAIRQSLVRTHTPGPIVATLVALALFCSLLAGYGLAGSKSMARYLHMLGFAIVVTGTVYIVLDYDNPRYGFIRIDYADAALDEVVKALK